MQNYPYLLHLDLISDFKAIADARLTKEKIKRKNPDEPDMDYFRLQQRMIVNRPRQIKIAKDFSCPVGYENALMLIEKTIQRGGNLHPFMTRNLKRLSNEDLMLSDWGIYHLHLSTVIDKKDGFMKRSDYLLMVRIDNSCVYFITTVPHKEKNIWTLKKYVQVIHDNWPETIERYKMPGVTALEHLSEEEHAHARKCHALVSTELDDGTCYMMIGGGYASDGTSSQAVRNHDYWYGMLKDAENMLRQEFQKDGMFRIKPELRRIIPDAALTDIHLVTFGDYGIWLFDNYSKLWIIMRLLTKKGKNNTWDITVTSYIWPGNLETLPGMN